MSSFRHSNNNTWYVHRRTSWLFKSITEFSYLLLLRVRFMCDSLTVQEHCGCERDKTILGGIELYAHTHSLCF